MKSSNIVSTVHHLKLKYMTNVEAVERFDQAHGTKIDKLFWIAGSLGSSNDLKDLLEDMSDKDFKRCFPEIYKSEYFKEYREDQQLEEALVDFSKFGLLAEVHVPEASNFKYKDGKPVSWSVHGGICQVEYVYAENLEELMTEIEKVSEKVFREHVKEDKKKIKV